MKCPNCRRHEGIKHELVDHGATVHCNRCGYTAENCSFDVPRRDDMEL